MSIETKETPGSRRFTIYLDQNNQIDSAIIRCIEKLGEDIGVQSVLRRALIVGIEALSVGAAPILASDIMAEAAQTISDMHRSLGLGERSARKNRRRRSVSDVIAGARSHALVSPETPPQVPSFPSPDHGEQDLLPSATDEDAGISGDTAPLPAANGVDAHHTAISRPRATGDKEGSVAQPATPPQEPDQDSAEPATPLTGEAALEAADHGEGADEVGPDPVVEQSALTEAQAFPESDTSNPFEEDEEGEAAALQPQVEIKQAGGEGAPLNEEPRPETEALREEVAESITPMDKPHSQRDDASQPSEATGEENQEGREETSAGSEAYTPTQSGTPTLAPGIEAILRRHNPQRIPPSEPEQEEEDIGAPPGDRTTIHSIQTPTDQE
ncbi:hypothetical protein A0U91_15790 (plasmid) [Acetobacter persici]|uniref:Uncharacterized protein n=2 Tax=Acetobacter persici TaxID=1076596 RepID=A0A1U9LJ45_9PROT|nr:hypothetical protein A0U91_15790 [Acetobacter persici]